MWTCHPCRMTFLTELQLKRHYAEMHQQLAPAPAPTEDTDDDLLTMAAAATLVEEVINTEQPADTGNTPDSGADNSFGGFGDGDSGGAGASDTWNSD